VHDRVELPEPVMLVGDRLHDRFVELVATVRVTVPAKPFTGETVIVDFPATPVLSVRLGWSVATVKSWML
jgi:hypothetical protein